MADLLVRFRYDHWEIDVVEGAFTHNHRGG